MEKEGAARHASFHDALTGLPNRALFDQRLEHGLVQAKRHGPSLGVMFLELEGFRILEAAHGPEAGEAVLWTIAERLKDNTRGYDTLSRHGGGQFLLLLAQISDESDVGLIAKKIIRAVQQPCDLRIAEVDFTATIQASIGISMFPGDGTTADMLVNQAHQAMYRAKRDRSGYSFAGGGVLAPGLKPARFPRPVNRRCAAAPPEDRSS